MTRKTPMRQCIGCREMKEKKSLIRVIRTPEGEIFLDKLGKQNGRGAYICHSKECMEKAEKSKALDRSFKMAVPKDVYDRLKKEFE